MASAPAGSAQHAASNKSRMKNHNRCAIAAADAPGVCPVVLLNWLSPRGGDCRTYPIAEERKRALRVRTGPITDRTLGEFVYSFEPYTSRARSRFSWASHGTLAQTAVNN